MASSFMTFRTKRSVFRLPGRFHFLPTLEPDVYAYEHLGPLAVPKVVYRCVTRDTPESFIRWLQTANASTMPQTSVLVGAPSGDIAESMAPSV